ncbi:MAG: hypothetical protein QM791_00510 [Ferruginibacter sp.]
MQHTINQPVDLKKVPESKTGPGEGLPPAVENKHDPLKEEIKNEVKESFKDENIPVEPVLGDDGDEVGGEG